MDTDQIMRAAYLGLLGTAIAGSYIAANKGNLGKVAQQAAIWFMIFVGMIAAIGLWNDVSRDVTQQHRVIGDEIVIPRGPDGHYYLTLKINGQGIDFIIDTGASDMVLTKDDAQRVGLDPDNLRYLGFASTANGEVRTARVQLDDVVLGPYEERSFRAVVNDGDLFGSLLGMSYLNLYSSLHITDGELVLAR